MYRLSLIISEIYNKYLPLAERDGIALNLDFSDTTREISDPERVKAYLDEHLDSTLKRSVRGEVTISVDQHAISITDSATSLSPAACALLSNRYIEVKSRVGFGTTVQIFFTPRPDDATTPRPELHLDSVGVSAQLAAPAPKETKHPTAQPTTTTKSTKSTKPAKPRLAERRAKRRLAVAAKKADREMKRITKKAEKQTRKLANKAKAKAKTQAKSKTPAKTTPAKSQTQTTKPQTKQSKTTKPKTVRKLRLS